MTLDELRKRLSEVDRELVGLIAARQKIVAEIGAHKIQHAVPTRDYEREREVLKCMVDGLNNNAIAETLFVSLGTVKFHISNIFHKLGVDSRVEAVKMAIEQKLV